MIKYLYHYFSIQKYIIFVKHLKNNLSYMLMQTLYFGNPTSIRLEKKQMKIEVDKGNVKLKDTVPIEDVGFIILDHPQIFISQSSIVELLKNNCAIVWCDEKHLPCGIALPMCVR